MFVEIDWELAYLFGDREDQIERVPVEDEAHARWVIESALNSGAGSAEMVR